MMFPVLLLALAPGSVADIAIDAATAYVGLVPAHKTGIVLLANRGDFPYEIARYRVLPELAREE